MKVNPLFVLREIADEYVVIPIGDKAQEVNGVLSLNYEGAFLWKLLETDQSEKSLIDALMANFDVEENVAKEDLNKFLQDLREIGCIE